jgi:hypothetical protein
MGFLPRFCISSYSRNYSQWSLLFSVYSAQCYSKIQESNPDTITIQELYSSVHPVLKLIPPQNISVSIHCGLKAVLGRGSGVQVKCLRHEKRKQFYIISLEKKTSIKTIPTFIICECMQQTAPVLKLPSIHPRSDILNSSLRVFGKYVFWQYSLNRTSNFSYSPCY